MKRVVLGIGAAAVLVALGVVIWFYASTGVDEDTEVTAPPIASEPSATGAVPSAAPETTAAETDDAGPGETAAASDTGATDSTASPEGTGPVVFELTDESTVSFELTEELRGEPTRVVATNEEVAGQLRFDPADLAATELGTIVVSSQTFVTDQSSRDRAIRGPILDSNAEPTIEFTPTSIEGLSGSAEPGDTFDLSVTGDLTIRGITDEVTFEGDATLVDPDRIEGSASATVSRSDFELSIPSVSVVANVSDEVLIGIDFVASPAV
jgi:polyisoprenoid-binding protein YceI